MEKTCEWDFVVYGKGWKDVKEMSCHMQSFNPIRRRHMSLKEEDTDNVVNCSERSFSTSILLRGVRARETRLNAMRG